MTEQACDKKRCRYKGEPYAGVKDTAPHTKDKTYNLCLKHWEAIAKTEGSMSDQVRDWCSS